MSSPAIASSPISVPQDMHVVSESSTTTPPTTPTMTPTPSTTPVPVKPAMSSYVMVGLCILILVGLWFAYHFFLYKFFRANPKFAALKASF